MFKISNKEGKLFTEDAVDIEDIINQVFAMNPQ